MIVSFSSLLLWSTSLTLNTFLSIASAFDPSTSAVSDFVGSPKLADGVGTYAIFGSTAGLGMSSDESFALISDSLHVIRYVTISTASVTTLAGSASGPGTSNGIGTNAQFWTPQGVCISPDQSYALVADSFNNLIRRIIISTAAVTTLAGVPSTSGSTNGIGTNARFFNPTGISLSYDGTYALVADNSNHVIRKIVISTSEVSRVAGTIATTGLSDGIGSNARFNSPAGVSISPSGLFALVADSTNCRIRYITISTASVTTLSGQTQGSIDGIGTNALYKNLRGIHISPDETYAVIADTGNNLIRKIMISTASVSTLAGTVGSSGNTNGVGTNSNFNNPIACQVSATEIYVADSSSALIRKVTISTAAVVQFAGNGGPTGLANDIGTNSKFNAPYSLSISSNGQFALVADSSNHVIRHITLSTRVVTTLAGTGTLGSTNGVGTNSLFNNPSGLSISPDSVFALIADTSNHLIRQIVISTTTVTTLAGVASSSGSTNGIGTNALFNSPFGAAISPDQTYALIADASNHLIRKITLSTADVTTLAGVATLSGSVNGIGSNARFNIPTSISISPDASFALVADRANHRIRRIVLSTASVTILAGASSGSVDGIGSNARFNNPSGVSLTPDGIYALIAERSNHEIRLLVVSTAVVTTVAGTSPSSGFVNGIGTNAYFNNPSGISISPDASYALIADSSNSIIRILSGTSVAIPTSVPSISPTLIPSTTPSLVPSISPTLIPSTTPSLVPSMSPTFQPSAVPTVIPTQLGDTNAPSLGATSAPTATPSLSPTLFPTTKPSLTPTAEGYTFSPTTAPSLSPTLFPTTKPSLTPTAEGYTFSPTTTTAPSLSPTLFPTTKPSLTPTAEGYTFSPTTTPSLSPTLFPTTKPSLAPTAEGYVSSPLPTSLISSFPTSQPSVSHSVNKTSDKASTSLLSENRLYIGIAVGVLIILCVILCLLFVMIKRNQKIAPYSHDSKERDVES